MRERFRSQYLFASYRAGRWERAYREIGPDRATFQQLVNLLMMDREWRPAAELIATRQGIDRDEAEILMLEARVKANLKQPAEAMTLLRQAYAKQSVEYQRRYYVSNFVTDMHAAGNSLAAYRDAPDRSAAFESLARALLSEKKDRDLKALLEEHGQQHADEPLCRYYKGELCLRRNEVARADEHFTVAMAKPRAPSHWVIRTGWLRARVKAGKAVATLKEQGATVAQFRELADLCVTEKNVGQLEVLLAAHRQTHQDDPDSTVTELDLKYLRGEYEAALKLLAQHREDLFSGHRLGWKHNDLQVRCLVKLKRTKEAVATAEAIIEDRHGSHLLLVLAHAAAADVKRTIAAMDVAPRSLLMLCYTDADLGPILKSERFREFQNRFPEQKSQIVNPNDEP